jgi:CBS domain-containing protein
MSYTFARLNEWNIFHHDGEIGFFACSDHAENFVLHGNEVCMDRHSTFIGLYNQLADHLITLTGSNEFERFYHLIDLAAEKNAAVKLHAQQLKKYGDFRNVIEHNNEFFDEPSEETLARFQALAKNILSPEPLLPTFQKDVHCFSPTESLGSALAYMRTNDYSQVVAYTGQQLALLTLEGIARWLAQSSENDTVLLKKCVIQDVLTNEHAGSFGVMSRNHSIYDAKDAFARPLGSGKTHLHAVIITQNGKLAEKPLGIVTPWDILEDTNI